MFTFYGFELHSLFKRNMAKSNSEMKVKKNCKLKIIFRNEKVKRILERDLRNLSLLFRKHKYPVVK